nr:hypothetical protein SHINE37_41229 [Rhizobiaceae bacterium]
MSVLPYIKPDSLFNKRQPGLFANLDGTTPPRHPPPSLQVVRAVRLGMAGAEGLEPPTCGFGDRRSTN